MLRKSILDFFDNKLKKAPQSSLVKALKNEFDIIKSNHENEVSFMTQALRDFDMQALGEVKTLQNLINLGLLTPEAAQTYAAKEQIVLLNNTNQHPNTKTR